MRPLQYNIYKGMGGKFGALQINLQDPHFYNETTRERDFTGAQAFENGKLKDGWKPREGAVFLEVTSAKDKNVYDWEQKIVLALSVDDLGKILLTLLTGDECKLIHDPGAKTAKAGTVSKSLRLESPNGIKQGVMLTVSEASGGNNRSHRVPISGQEVVVLTRLLRVAISRILGW